jgi:apolipoprotein N-acyltransferase
VRRKQHKKSQWPNGKHGKQRTALDVLFLALVILSAYSMTLSLAAPTLHWLGWLAFLPLLQAAKTTHRLRASFAGLAWGLTFFGFAGLGSGGLVVPSVGSFLLLTLVPTAFTLAGSLITRRIGFSPFVLSVAWMIAELALNPLKLSHGVLAATQGDGWLLQSIGGVFGYVIVGFVVAYASALLLAAIGVIPSWRPNVSQSVTGADVRAWIVEAFSSVPAMQPCRVSAPRAPPRERLA